MMHDSPAIGTLTFDEAGLIQTFDATSERLFGYGAPDAVGQPVARLVPALCRASGDGGPDGAQDAPAGFGVRRDGTPFPLWCAVNEVRLGGQRLQVCSVADLSERAAADAAQARLAALVASSSDAIISKTLDGIVTSWNPAAAQLFGYTEREMIGQPMARLIPAERAGEEAQILAQIRRGGLVDHFETVRQRKSGERFHVSVTISPIKDARGVIVGASKIARDITERRAVEAELRQHRDHLRELVANAAAEVNAIVQTAISGIVTVDAGGVVHLFNPAAEALFGWSRHDVIGKRVDLLLGDWWPGPPERAVALGQREISARRRDGSSFPARIAVGHAQLSAAEQFFVVFIADISEQKRVEDTLRCARDEALAGARAKAAFTANMSHEIRTPMNAIIGFAEVVLQDARLPAASAEHLRIIRSSARALMAIINDILDVSKLDSGKFALESVAFHLPNALADALKLVERQAADKGLGIALDYHAALPARVIGDPTRLRQVVLNLLGNAIKFTARGRVKLSVAPGEGAGMLRFSVADTGIGMTPAQIDTVFESFSQGDASTTRRFGGTGLGAAISKQLVELMGGAIRAESEPGRGSVFHFTAHLPAAPAGAACLYDVGGAAADGYRSPRAFRVLLVEDVVANAALARLRLEQQGHKVDWRENGRQAVAACASGRYDLVLMDVMMPEMDGLDATRAIRALERGGARHTPVLALTASIMHEDYARCMEAGMDSVHAKPVDFDALLAAMELAVPEGGGRPNGLRRIALGAGDEVDFSPLDGVADHVGALRTWRDPRAYAKALAAFAAERARDADQIGRLLAAHPDDVAPARGVAHALKGLAGNLFVAKVAGRAAKIDAALKSHDRATAGAELRHLRWALEEAAAAIAGVAPGAPGAAPARAFGPGEARALFGQLADALAELNPEAAEPMLARLADHVPPHELAPLRSAVDAFDFDRARERLAALARAHGLERGADHHV